MKNKSEYQMMIDFTIIMDYPRMIEQLLNQKQHAMAYYLLEKEKKVLESNNQNHIWLHEKSVKQTILHYTSSRLDGISDSIDKLESLVEEGELYDVPNSFKLEVLRYELANLYRLFKLAIYNKEEEFLCQIVQTCIPLLNQILLHSKKESEKRVIELEKQVLLRQIH